MRFVCAFVRVPCIFQLKESLSLSLRPFRRGETEKHTPNNLYARVADGQETTSAPSYAPDDRIHSPKTSSIIILSACVSLHDP